MPYDKKKSFFHKTQTKKLELATTIQNIKKNQKTIFSHHELSLNGKKALRSTLN